MGRQMDMFKPNSGWRRKKGLDRKVGYRRLNNWTPAAAHKFCMTRVAEIELLLQEIAICYDEIDQSVVATAEDIQNSALADIRAALDEALSEGRTA